MKIGILKEHKSGEKRVAIVPSTVSALSKKGYEFFLVSDSGLLSNYSDNDYKEACLLYTSELPTMCVV